jgi:malate dehydrogenase
MLAAVCGGRDFPWPVGCYVNEQQLVMAADTHLGPDGTTYTMPTGNERDMNGLEQSMIHLRALRSQAIQLGILPPLGDWPQYNQHLA